MNDHNEAAKFAAHIKSQHDAVHRTMCESSDRIEEYIDCVTYSVEWIIAESEMLSGCVRYFNHYYKDSSECWGGEGDKARACYLLDKAVNIIINSKRSSDTKANTPGVALLAFCDGMKNGREQA